MKNLHHTEEKFKDILEDVSFNVDSSEIWATISDRLPKEEKRDKPFWFFFTLALGFVLVAGQMIYFATANSDDFSSQIVSENEAVQTQLNSSNALNIKVTTIDDSSTNSIDNKQAKQKSILNKNQLDLQSPYNNSIPNAAETLPISQMTSANYTIPNFATPIITNDLEQHTKTIFKGTSKNTNKIFEISEDNSLALTNSLKAESIYEDSQVAIVQDFDFLPTLSNIKALEFLRTEKDFQAQFVKPLNKSAKKLATFYSLRTGLNLSQSSYSIISPDNDQIDFSSEKDLIGHSTDFLFGLETLKGWRLSTGISYSYTASRYANRNQTSYTQLVEGVESTLITVTGQEIPQFGQVMQTVTLDEELRWHRRHKSFDLQVILGKQVFALGKFSVNAEIGGSINLNTSNSGYYYDNTTQIITRFNQGEENPYKNNTGVRLHTGVALEYKINQLSVGLNSFYRTIPNSITQNNLFNLKKNQLGLQLNLTYRPNW